jgi:hypothetical protein
MMARTMTVLIAVVVPQPIWSANVTALTGRCLRG